MPSISGLEGFAAWKSNASMIFGGGFRRSTQQPDPERRWFDADGGLSGLLDGIIDHREHGTTPVSQRCSPAFMSGDIERLDTQLQGLVLIVLQTINC